MVPKNRYEEFQYAPLTLRRRGAVVALTAVLVWFAWELVVCSVEALVHPPVVEEP